MKFYKCNRCGNVIIRLIDSTAPISCCGDTMQELIPGSVDAATEKHVPQVTIDGQVINVQVGEVEHPMTDEHYIGFIVLETKAGSQIRELSPNDKPQASFVMADGDVPVRVYEYCNLHGLWVKEL